MPDLVWWWNAGVPTLVGVTYLWNSLARRHRRLRLWERIAKAQGRDSEVKTSGLLARRAKLTARSGPNEVRITDARGTDGEIVVEIEGPEGFSTVKLRRQLFKPRTREIEIGDESFDKQLLLEGPALEMGARLDEIMRRRLLSAISGCSSLEIGGGRLRAEVPEEELRRILPILLAIGRRLAEPMAAESQIAKNARRDPVAGVRLFNLLLLARERPGTPETLDVLRKACSDKSAEVRLRAAIELGDAGRGVLLKLAEKSVDDGAAAQAVSHLGPTLPFESLRDILSRSTSKGLPRTALASLEALGHHRAAAVGLLAHVMAEEKGELAITAARALGTTGETAAEPPLLQTLQSEDDDLRETAAAALGHVGTAAAVQPLKDAAERSWLALGLRRAARQAIAEIQSRLVGASPGQLSLAGADTEAGRLSLATAEAGQLALATDGAGELALQPHATDAEDAPRDRSPRRVRH
jgi:hypothetical protein